MPGSGLATGSLAKLRGGGRGGGLGWLAGGGLGWLGGGLGWDDLERGGGGLGWLGGGRVRDGWGGGEVWDGLGGIKMAAAAAAVTTTATTMTAPSQ